MLPRIGVNTNVKSGARTRGCGRLLTLSPDYARSIRQAGGVAILLPPLPDDREAVASILDGLDGLVLSGGDDMNPAAYGQQLNPATSLVDEERDQSDLLLAQMALDRDLPILGVCGGMQLFNVLKGGTLHQHLADLRESLYPKLYAIHDAQDTAEELHPVQIESGSRLAEIMGPEALMTNSRHHQAVDQPGQGIRISARSDDGVIEGLECTDQTFCIGVQWHPEEHQGENRHQRLFQELIKACLLRSSANGANP